MAEFQLTITAEERQYLLDLLERRLAESLVEERHAHKRTYRKDMLHQEDLVQSLLNKFRQLQA